LIRVPIPARLSARIAEIRHRAGLTQYELSQLTGIGPRSIGAYETGRTEPRIINLLRIMKACGVTPIEFFDREIRLWESPVASWPSCSDEVRADV
jgi:transcriptional regulator with XRE-family HTH domain